MQACSVATLETLPNKRGNAVFDKVQGRRASLNVSSWPNFPAEHRDYSWMTTVFMPMNLF
jgi:hypothetical protein